MRLEQNDKNILFETTEIPDVFFTEYLSMANGDFIKVYLYMLFLSKYNRDIKINELSKILALPFPIIQEAIKFWEDSGVIIRKNNSYVLHSLQDAVLNKLYRAKITSSPEDIQNNEKNQYRAKAIESINASFFQGVMSPSWYHDIDFWFNKYGFDEQVMISLFQYCYSKSALHKKYVQAVAEAWFRNKIKTYTDLDAYYQKQDKLVKIKKSIAKKLGLNRDLTSFEEAYIEKWIVDFEYDMPIIEIALKKTTSKTNPSFDYINKLISDWKERSLKTPQDVEQYLKVSKQKEKNIKELEKKASFNSYEQRNYSDLDSLYANVSSSN